VSRANEPIIRVPVAFDDEFPAGSRLATETFINVGILVGAVQSAIEQMVAAEGLPSAAAFNVLSVLDGDPAPLRPSVIAERMMVTRATTTGLLDTLERRGLLRRAPAGGDGRSREVTLTDDGRRVVRRLVPAMHTFERDLMCTLADDDLSELLAMVAALQAQLVAMVPGVRFGIRS
jgi:DNA-binding MarR family transcriptional regulator